MIVRLICLLMLVVSLYGYIQFFSSRTRPEFALGITFTSIGSIMFFAGILNVLPYAAYTVCGLGVVLAVYSLIKRDRIFALITPGTVFFVIMTGVLFFILHDSLFTNIDNFTHWATAAKTLLQNDAFPRPYDINIYFQSYPLGSASFIYYIAKIYGAYPEWIMMLAQDIFILGCLISVFAFAKNIPGYIIAASTVAVLLCSNINLVDLLVDTLLPSVAFCAIAICFYYKDDIKKAVLLTIPFTAFLTSLKNSGLFFVIIILAYLFVEVVRRKEYLTYWIVGVISPIVTFVAWRVHVKRIFPKGMLSKHSLSVENMEQVLGDKTVADVKEIFNLFCREMFSLENSFVFVILFIIAILVLQKYILKAETKNLNQSFIFSVVVYLGYQLGNLAMYMLTMPKKEAFNMAGYDRYHRTILIFIVGFICINILKEIDFSSKILSSKAVYNCGLVVISILLICLSIKPDFSYYKRQVIDENSGSVAKDRVTMDMLIAEHNAPWGKKVILLVGDKRDYLHFVSAHFLKSAVTSLRTVDDMIAAGDEYKEFEYIIVFDTSEEILNYVQETFGVTDARVIHTVDY